MEPTRKPRQQHVAIALGVAAMVGLAAATTVSAQQQPGGRMRILVPALEAQGGAKPNIGREIAEALQKQIDELPTHAPVDRRELRDALRRFKVKEEDLNCILSRQLAVQINAELVLCGTYEPSGSGLAVAAHFINARSGESFDVPRFEAANAREAASQIFERFDSFTQQIRLTTFCVDYLGSQQWENALQNCNRALELNPSSETALYSRARALVELERLEEALDDLEKLFEVNPIHQDGLLTAGYVATKLNQHDRALRYYNQYLELNPGDVDVRLKLAVDLARDGNPAGALQMMEDGMNSQEGQGNLVLVEYAGHFAMAAAQKIEEEQGANGGANRPPEAVELYNRAIGYYEKVFTEKGAETEDATLNRMLQALNALDRVEEAVDLGARAVAAKPESGSLWSTYATALQRAGRLEEALAALDSALAKDPETPSAYARRGQWLVARGQFDAAKEAFRTALERGEVDSNTIARAIFSIGYNDYFRQNKRMEAVSYFDLTREFATDAVTKAMAAYFTGFAYLQEGIKVQEPQTLQSARQALPMFQRALQMFEQARPYQQADPRNARLDEAISNVQTYIEIQEAIIKRGR